MNVVDELKEKIETYFDNQIEQIQNSFLEGNIEAIKEEIEFKVYVVQKLINQGIQIDDDSIAYKYKSLENCNIDFDSKQKLVYKNQQPFFFINKDNFDINNCYKNDDDEIDIIFLEFLLLAFNQNWDELNNDNKLWFFIPHCEVDEEKLESFVQFILLTNGKTVHNHIEATQNQFLEDNIKNNLECNTKNFNQYQESAYILSEYNHAKDILQKYLLLYHIIENFMYRRPIAEMADKNFTIRDFKSLYRKVNETEEQTLKALLKKIQTENISGTDTVEQYFDKKLESYRLSLSGTNDINEIFTNMTLSSLNGLNYSNASKLIYYFRNCIIHNKETEFHITHTILNSSSDLVKFFEIFLLPTLENIIYFLIFKENSIIDYPKNYILLYGENNED